MVHDCAHNKKGRSPFITATCVVSFHAVAFMRFRLAAYSQSESITPLQVDLVLDPFGGTGTGSQSITRDIIEQITALVQVGDTATGK